AGAREAVSLGRTGRPFPAPLGRVTGAQEGPSPGPPLPSSRPESRPVGPPWPSNTREVPMSFVLLKDPNKDEQVLIRNDHISAVEGKKEDESVHVPLLGGQTLHLTHEQAKQFVYHVKTNMHPAPKT